MNVPTKKQLWTLTRMFLPFVGFGMTCLGAYLMSQRMEDNLQWKGVLAYVMMALGFLAVLVGVFWTICHNMKSKLYRRQQEREWQMEIYTIERPSCFPPSYDESQGSQPSPAAASDFSLEVDVVMSLAPPLYSLDSSNAPDCRWSWERPPRYSQMDISDSEESSINKGAHLNEPGLLC